MANNVEIEVLEGGDVTVLNFKGPSFLGGMHVGDLRQAIHKILEEQNAKVLQFDLSNVALLTSDMLGFLISLKSKDLDVVLYCGTGGRSALAAETMAALGYRNVRSLAGGIVPSATNGSNTLFSQSDGFV